MFFITTMPNPEHFSTERENIIENIENGDNEEIREEGEPWNEKFEVDGNQLEICFTGRKESEAETGKDLSEINKIELITPENKRFDFSSLLPEGWKFERIDESSPVFNMGTAHVEKSIHIPKSYRETKSRWTAEGEALPPSYQEEDRGREVNPWGEITEWKNVSTLNNPEAPIVLLHEIGHAHQARNRKGEKIRKKIEETEKKEQEKATPISLTRQEMELYYQHVVAIERDAWAYALNKYRELKKEGIDILPKAKTNREVLDIVNNGVNSYLTKIIHYTQFKEVKRELAKRKKTTIQEILGKLKTILNTENSQ